MVVWFSRPGAERTTRLGGSTRERRRGWKQNLKVVGTGKRAVESQTDGRADGVRAVRWQAYGGRGLS